MEEGENRVFIADDKTDERPDRLEEEKLHDSGADSDDNLEETDSLSWDEDEEVWSFDEDDSKPAPLPVQSYDHVAPEAMTQIMRAEVYQNPPESFLQTPNEGCRPVVSMLSCKRIQSDIKDFHMKGTPPGIHLYMDEDRMEILHLVIEGPVDTPYEAGFFLFVVDFTGIDYPNYPPRVKIVNTHNGRIRYNPNIYADGKVCLSILGTWRGPGWMPSMSITSIALSIQSLLGENPIANEPGYSNIKPGSASAIGYNDECRYLTVMSSVIFTLSQYVERVSLPEDMVDKLKRIFRKNYRKYMEILDRIRHLEGKQVMGQYYHASLSLRNVDHTSFHLTAQNAFSKALKTPPAGPHYANPKKTHFVCSPKPPGPKPPNAAFALFPEDEPSTSAASGFSLSKRPKKSKTLQTADLEPSTSQSNTTSNFQPAQMFNFLLGDDRDEMVFNKTTRTDESESASRNTEPAATLLTGHLDIVDSLLIGSIPPDGLLPLDDSSPSTSQCSFQSMFSKNQVEKANLNLQQLRKAKKCHYCGYTGGSHMVNCMVSSLTDLPTPSMALPAPLLPEKREINSCSYFKIAECRKKLEELAEKCEDCPNKMDTNTNSEKP